MIRGVNRACLWDWCTLASYAGDGPAGEREDSMDVYVYTMD